MNDHIYILQKKIMNMEDKDQRDIYSGKNEYLEKEREREREERELI